MDDGHRFLIISGLSGAGKTVALHALEDAGFYCVDNLPVGILETFATHLEGHDLPHFDRVAVGVDARNLPSAIAQLPATLDNLARAGVAAELLFIDASDETLLKRFSETRRKHPLSTEEFALADAIERERILLDPLTRRADLRLDTTHMNVHQLRNTIRELVTGRTVGTMALQLQSFGFKNGVPADADFVFDMRALPNPYWEMDLRDLSGRDGPVRAFLEASPLVREMVTDVTVYLDAWVPRFEAVNRSYLTVAFGCTGGRHRSVYMVETVARHFAARGRKAVISHRDT
ncbi:MAG: RNase adapter RapZ [Gammaproteobacteria bacterium]